VEDGVVVEAPGGAGAGRIEAPFDGYLGSTRIEPGSRRGGPPDSHAIVVEDLYHRLAITFLDGNGVRLDDGITERVVGRLGALGFALLAIAAVLFASLGFVLSRRIGAAASLEAPDLFGGSAPLRALKALEGTLSLACVSTARTSKWKAPRGSSRASSVFVCRPASAWPVRATRRTTDRRS
jgi:hypothetical protein